MASIADVLQDKSDRTKGVFTFDPGRLRLNNEYMLRISIHHCFFLVLAACAVISFLMIGGCEEKPRVPSKTLLESAEQGDAYNVRGHAYYGLDPVDIQDESGWTPLHYAAARGHNHIVPILIGYKADLEIRNDLGNTPLMEAVAADQDVTLEQLLRAGADHTVGDAQGRTPLAIAVEQGNEKLAKVLLKHGADPERANVHLQQSCLWVAANDSRSDMVDLLIEHGADVNAQAEIPPGRYVLHVAISRGNRQIVERLLAAGARLDVTDNAGRTPLDYARQSDSKMILKMLEDASRSQE